MALALSMRRTSVHPDGAVIVAVFGRTEMEATMTSPCTVPVGLFIVSEPDAAALDAAARKAGAARDAALASFE